MDNLKDFTKSEFLSFLYAEKSREIENNSVPGWNKWVLWSAIITIVIYIYRLLSISYFKYEIVGAYSTTLLAIILFVIHFYCLNSNGRTFIPGKVRPLKKEAPVLSYIYQFVLCLFCIITQLLWPIKPFVFWNLIVGLGLNGIILIYISINRNEFVLARLKTRVFVNKKIDFLFTYLVGWAYLNVIIYSIIYSRDYYFTEFKHNEFELAAGIFAFISIFYLLLNLWHTNTKTAEGLDKIINKFIIGTITQEDAYKLYIMLMYGYSAYQAIREHFDEILLIKNNCDEKKKYLDNIEEKLDKEECLSPEKIDTLLVELLAHTEYYDNSCRSIQKALTDIKKILKLQPELGEQFEEIITQLKESVYLMGNLQNQSVSVFNKIKTHFIKNKRNYDASSCSKCGKHIPLKYWIKYYSINIFRR